MYEVWYNEDKVSKEKDFSDYVFTQDLGFRKASTYLGYLNFMEVVDSLSLIIFIGQQVILIIHRFGSDLRSKRLRF